MTILYFIIYLLAEIIMIHVMLSIYKKMINTGNKIPKKKLLLIFLLCILAVLNNYYNNVSVRFILAFIIVIMINKIGYKNSLKKTIIFSIIFTIISIIMEILTSGLLLVSIDNINSFNNHILFKFFYSIFNSTLIYIIISNNKTISLIKKLESLIKEKINFYVLSLLLIIFLNIMTIVRGIHMNNFYVLLLSIICMIFMLFTIKIIINDKYNIKMLETINKSLKDSYKMYAKTIDEGRELRHNLKNDLYAVKSTLPKEKQDILNMIITKYNKNYEWINCIDDIPEGLQGLLYLKKNEAKQNKVKMILNSNKTIKENEPKDYFDLCDTIGILIDNAIEASKKTKNKIIEINIKENFEIVEIKIINKFKNNIDLNRIGKKNYSTKEFKSGLGLNYLKKLKNNKLKINYEIVNDLFITNILYKQKINNR